MDVVISRNLIIFPVFVWKFEYSLMGLSREFWVFLQFICGMKWSLSYSWLENILRRRSLGCFDVMILFGTLFVCLVHWFHIKLWENCLVRLSYCRWCNLYWYWYRWCLLSVHFCALFGWWQDIRKRIDIKVDSLLFCGLMRKWHLSVLGLDYWQPEQLNT